MDLMSDDAIGAFGLLVSEACERLVDSHAESLDKRAAMLSVESPVFSQDGGAMNFSFSVSGNRQKPVETSITVGPDSDIEDAEFDFELTSVALKTIPVCECSQFGTDKQCAHSLAAAWWLQEQLGRRSITQVLEFFGELEVDSVAEGRDLVNDLLTMAAGCVDDTEPESDTRLQWRISLTSSRYYSPVSITPYEQRPRKNGKGWTKGREVRAYDLLRRNFHAHPVDGRIAALAGAPSYSFDGDHFNEFQALREMIGHPSIAWDDANATQVTLTSAELIFTLDPVEVELGSDEADEQHREVQFRPRVDVGGMKIDLGECEMIMGFCSPAERPGPRVPCS